MFVEGLDMKVKLEGKVKGRADMLGGSLMCV